ncbi:hypothetical protein [Hyphomicrobium sp.]|jgi:hypothetical protein|uniref:hypothetical protein n=1 Tax=Hyphomicrobium sp. TaxID=82 RepID=UPI002C165726|nr:hypothetical protein [Hyphomicrobium sp.]HVZ03507.1 hypothetical protein [Hyphomicrobium sp.]
MTGLLRILTFCAIAGAFVLAGGAAPARAVSTIEFLASLSDSEIDQFRAWKEARSTFNDQTDAYWDAVENKRQVRRRKRSAKIPFSQSDYVMRFPPRYTGPSLSPSLAKKYYRFVAQERNETPQPRKELATIDDYLDAAKRVYHFVPERLTEREFKLRYAKEARALGLSKDQVVRVYALETGGRGTYDMQAGIHPTKKTGRAISSALGYAQLLNANSVNELARSGATFIAQLKRMIRNPNNTPARTAALRRKLVALRHMYANVKRLRFEWHVQQAYAKTDAGMGIHVLNIDGDIGPMLQAMKLKTLKDTAAKQGRASLTGAELELMNLAGPMTGLEMMEQPGSSAPTTNFFSRRAYYVNKMVKGLTAAQLRAEIDRRMTQAITNPGCLEFAEAFDSISERRSASER